MIKFITASYILFFNSIAYAGRPDAQDLGYYGGSGGYELIPILAIIAYIWHNGWNGWVAFIGSVFYGACAYGLVYWLDSTSIGRFVAAIVGLVVWWYAFTKLHNSLDNKLK